MIGLYTYLLAFDPHTEFILTELMHLKRGWRQRICVRGHRSDRPAQACRPESETLSNKTTTSYIRINQHNKIVYSIAYRLTSYCQQYFSVETR